MALRFHNPIIFFSTTFFGKQERKYTLFNMENQNASPIQDFYLPFCRPAVYSLLMDL